MKKSKWLVVFGIILIITVGGVIGTYYFYNLNQNDSENLVEPNSNNFIEIYKKNDDYKVYLKDDTNKEIDQYQLYKTIGLNLKNETIDNVQLNINNNILNGIIINYKEQVDNKDAYSNCNNYYHHIFCKGKYDNNKYIEDDCVLYYSSYYNFENNKNLFKDYKVEFSGFNDKNIVTYGGGTQEGDFHEIIFNIQQEKIVIDDLKKFGASTVFVLDNDGKNYVYVSRARSIFLIHDKTALYDEFGNNIIDIEDGHKFALILDNKDKSEAYYVSDLSLKCKGYYYAKDGIIEKYELPNKLIAKSEKYDDVLYVLEDYSLIYKKMDNSIYIVANDGNYSKKITEKTASEYSMERRLYENTNEIVIVDSSDIMFNSCATRYILDLNSDKISIIEGGCNN